MTFHKRVTLRCDCDGCIGCGQMDRPLGCFEVYEHDTGRATDAREYAKKTGWVYRSGEDYCPDCK